MSISRTKMLQVSKCLIGLAVMMLQSCDVADNRRDLLCGNWESVEGKPDVLLYKEGEAYKVTVFKRSGIRRKLKPETYHRNMTRRWVLSLRVHHRRNGKSRGVPSGGAAGRRHRSLHPAAGRKAKKQGINKNRFINPKRKCV